MLLHNVTLAVRPIPFINIVTTAAYSYTRNEKNRPYLFFSLFALKQSDKLWRYSFTQRAAALCTPAFKTFRSRGTNYWRGSVV
jgi:hypothetical protein